MGTVGGMLMVDQTMLLVDPPPASDVPVLPQTWLALRLVDRLRFFASLVSILIRADARWKSEFLMIPS